MTCIRRLTSLATAAALAAVGFIALSGPAAAVPPCDPVPAKCFVSGKTIQSLVMAKRDFIVSLRNPDAYDGQTIVLLHGSGGNETSLMDLASSAAPNARLIGIRGRIVQDGTTRWYKRITPTAFDQADIRHEASAFVTFLADLSKRHELDLEKTTFLGYSNGANLIAAMTLLHPGVVRKAVLLRPMPVLDATPAADLAKASFLTVAGVSDRLYAPFAPALSSILSGAGAKVDARMIPADHMLGKEDARIVASWLSGGTTKPKR